MIVVAAPLKLTGAHTQKRNAVAVFRIHIRVYLKNEACEFIFIWLHNTQRSFAVNRRWRNANKRVEQFLNTKIIYSTSEENRGNFSTQVILHIEIRINAFNQLYIMA